MDGDGLAARHRLWQFDGLACVGPVSSIIAKPVAWLGHRGLTHDLLLAPLLAFLFVTWAAHHHTGRLASVAVIIGLAARAILVKTSAPFTGLRTLAVSVAGAWWVVGHNLDLGQRIPLVVVGGILVHLAGDAVTVRRLPVPILWAFGSDACIGVPIFRAGKTFEQVIVAPALLVLVCSLAQQHYNWWGWVQPHLARLTAS